MAATLKPYPTMKDSGVPWLGEVPAHWEVQRAARRLTVVKRPVNPNEISDQQVVHYSIPNVQQVGRGVLESGSSIDSAKNLVDRTLLLVSKLNPRKGTIALAEPDRGFTTLASSEFVAMEPKHCVGRFARYLYESEHIRLELSSRVDSATKSHQRCSPEDISKLPIPWPPLPEQAAIVRFLDHADRRIRRYIRAKQKLIALLEEQKQAIIHQAVTGQIDVRTGQPYPAYKPSGVEWLGKVPAHWERQRLKTLLRSVDRRSTTGKETLLSLRRDHGVVVYAEHFARPPQGRTLAGFKLVAVGQLVVNRMQANNGLVFCSGINGLVSPDYSVFEMREPLQMQYLSDLLRTSGYRTHFRREATGLGTGTAGFLRLYDEKLLQTTVFLPPFEEQTLILKSLAEGMARINRLIEREQRELQLMGEYRTRLIADVVTGKLDVREAAAALPEVDPLAAEDELDDSLTATGPEVDDKEELIGAEY